jgi:hypothetical protein
MRKFLDVKITDVVRDRELGQPRTDVVGRQRRVEPLEWLTAPVLFGVPTSRSSRSWQM